jgi:glycosyltransferase involved in cell wall biosynthesis
MTSGNERPLTILQVVTTAVGGDWFHDQAVGLVRRGHTVLAVVPAEGPLATRLRASGVEVRIVPLCGWRPRQLPRVANAELRLIKLIREFKPDVVHAHLLKAIIACRVANLFGRPNARVSQIAGAAHLRSPLFRGMDRLTLPCDDVVIGSCTAFAERYRRMGARRVAVSHYGCDVHRLDPTASGAAFRAEHGLDPATPTVGIIAHMYPTRIRAFRDIGVKGHEVLIDAVPRLLSRVPDVQVFIVGDDLASAGTYREDLYRRAERLGVADRVRFTGHRADVQNVIAAMDVLVNASLDESASYSMVEALLMEKGVVASDVGGLPDTVQHRETGLLVPPADPVALADAVADLLGDAQWRRTMGQLGRQRCLRRFDIDRTVSNVETIYRTTLAARRRGAR